MIYQLRIAHLYPEQMNIYGDRGNILALAQRCAWRGIGVELLPVGVGMQVDWAQVDLAFFGGGQDSGQALIAADFVERQGPVLRAAVEDGLVLLSICGGYQLLGHTYVTHTGEQLPGVGVFDARTIGGEVRLIGNIVVETGNWEPGTGGQAQRRGELRMGAALPTPIPTQARAARLRRVERCPLIAPSAVSSSSVGSLIAGSAGSSAARAVSSAPDLVAATVAGRTAKQ